MIIITMNMFNCSKRYKIWHWLADWTSDDDNSEKEKRRMADSDLIQGLKRLWLTVVLHSDTVYITVSLLWYLEYVDIRGSHNTIACIQRQRSSEVELLELENRSSCYVNIRWIDDVSSAKKDSKMKDPLSACVSPIDVMPWQQQSSVENTQSTF